MHKLLLMLMAFCLGVHGFAQVKGRVVEPNVSKKGFDAVPGVVIFWKNTSIVTTSDSNGVFKIASTNKTNKLVVTALGYKTDTLLIKDTTKFITIKLKGGVDLSEI